MAIALQQVEGGTRLRLEGTIDITVAGELKSALLQGLSSASALQIDPSELTYLDVTALQLLWAAAHESTASGVSLIFEAPLPAPVRSTLEEAGFQEMLAMLDCSLQPRSSLGEMR